MNSNHPKQSKNMKTMNQPSIVDRRSFLKGVGVSHGVGWICLDLKTGEERWIDRRPGKGSIAFADGMPYCLGENGKMGLVEANPSGQRRETLSALGRAPLRV